jgi:hypothetical protein
MALLCPYCNTTNLDDAPACAHCGNRLRCPHCYALIEPSPVASPMGDFCQNCGNRFTQTGGLPNFLRIMGIIIFACFASLLGLLGSCFILFSTLNGGQDSAWLIGILLLGAAGALVYAIVKLFNRK